jgi:hypothetical protein
VRIRGAARHHRRAIGRLALFVVLAWLMTGPPLGDLARRVPGDAGDPLFVTWTMQSVAHHLPQGWGALWELNAFEVPDARLVLAYSDTLLPLAPVFALISWAGRSPALAYNLLLLGAWVVSLWSTDRLARRIIGSEAGALVAAVVFTFSSVRLVHYRHLQLAWGCLLPLALIWLWELLEAPSKRRGARFGVLAAVLTLIASYYGLLLLLSTAVIVAVRMARARDRALMRPLLVGAATYGVLVAPIAVQYLRLQRDAAFRRTPDDLFFAHWSDLVSVDIQNRFVTSWWPLAGNGYERPSERWLFPGFVCLALVAVALIALVRKRRVAARSGELRELGVAAGVMAVLSFGNWAVIGGRRFTLPYEWLATVVPGLAGVRVPARFVVLAMLALALVAGSGVATLVRGRRPVVVRVVVVALLAAVLFEGRLRVETVSLDLREESVAVNHELARRPDGVVLELPIRSEASGPAWTFVEAPRLFASTIDWKPRVNGVSGFQPPGFDALAAHLNRFPEPGVLEQLDRLEVRYVVLRLAGPIDIGPARMPQFERDGVGVFSEAHARAVIERLPPGAVRRVDRIESAFLIELV